MPLHLLQSGNMKNLLVSIIFLLMQYKVSFVSAQNASILSSPVSQNTTEGSLATFTCIGIGILFRWIVDGHYDGTAAVKNRGVDIITKTLNEDTNLKESKLRLPATIQNSNITIQCYMVGIPYSDGPSNPALLLVQGLLEPVKGLILHSNQNCQYISWCPPTTIEGVPILNYQVILSDISTNSVLINSTTTINIYTLCSLTFSDDHSYMVQVAGVNSLGLGHMAMIIKYNNASHNSSNQSCTIENTELSSYYSIVKSASSRNLEKHSITECTATTTTRTTIVTVLKELITNSIECSPKFIKGDDDWSSPIIITVSIMVVVLVSILGFICGAISITVWWNSSKSGSGNKDIPLQVNQCYEEVKLPQHAQ